MCGVIDNCALYKCFVLPFFVFVLLYDIPFMRDLMPSNKNSLKSATSDALAKLYYDPESPASYASIRKLAKYAAQHGITEKQCEAWLQGQDAYTMHRKVVKQFQRTKYLVLTMNDIWQADLCVMNTLSKYNDGIRYLLFVIDCFSRFLYVIPMQQKTAVATCDAFEALFRGSVEKPKNFMVDQGGEFLNYKIKKFMEKHKVNYYCTDNTETKCVFAERVIRTIKDKLYRHMTANNTHRYIDVLPKIISTYNNTVHSAIKMAPTNVNKENECDIRDNVLKSISKQKRQHQYKDGKKLRINDTVRITKITKAFTKGYETKWTEEIFKISGIVKGSTPIRYRLTDLYGQVIRGSFYQQEIQKVNPKRFYKVESILAEGKRAGKNGRKEDQVLVKYLGYPASMAEWIPRSSLKTL